MKYQTVLLKYLNTPCVFGLLPKGPLAILKESCTRECDLRIECDKPVNEYLIYLKQKLIIARDYAAEHSKREQQRYASHYNLSSQDKHFTVGESALLLLFITQLILLLRSSASGEVQPKTLK